MTDEVDQARRWKLIARGGCAALIVAHSVLLIWSASRNSVTFDEYAHLPAGVAYWKFGWRAFAVHNLSPPLVRLIAAAPVVVAGAEAPDCRARSGAWAAECALELWRDVCPGECESIPALVHDRPARIDAGVVLRAVAGLEMGV